MIVNHYRIPCNSISVRNPQANTIVERVHQTIGNIIRTFKIQEMDLDNENPWEGILSSTMFAIRSMVHTTTQHTPFLIEAKHPEFHFICFIYKPR